MTKKLQTIRKRVAAFVADNAGITGLETAIVLIAFVVVSSVFAFAALSTGLFSSDQAKETIRAGLSEAQGTLELRGSVLAEDTDTDGQVDIIYFQVANAAGGDSIDLTPGKTVIRYTDADQTLVRDATNEYMVTPQGNADADNHLETDEILEIRIPNLQTLLTTPLPVSKTFSLQVLPPQGATLYIERSTPASMSKYNDLN